MQQRIVEFSSGGTRTGVMDLRSRPAGGKNDVAKPAVGVAASCAELPFFIRMADSDTHDLRALGPSDMTGRWWVAQVASHHEQRVVRELGVLGDIGAYLPMVHVRRHDGKRKRRSFIPLFPSYVFLCLSDAADIGDVRRLDSVYGIIVVNNQSKLVRELATVHLATLRGEIQPYRLPVHGERCRVISGPYLGTEGKVIRAGDAMLFVLEIEALGTKAELHIPPENLEVIESNAA